MEWGPRGWGIGILFVICVLGEINTKAAETPTTVTKKTVADSLYQTAINTRDQAPLKESLDAFKKVLKSDPKHALAHYHLAKLYAKSNTVNDRQRAKRAIEKATQIAPSNAEFRLAFGDILWQQGHWNEAEAQYQKAFQIDTLNADTAFKIGATALDAYLKFIDLHHLDKINPINQPLTSRTRGQDGATYHLFDWTHFAEKTFKRATDFLQKSIQIDPTHCKAYYKLGLAHYENNEPGKLIEISGQLLKHIPGDKDALLFMALGFQAINRLDQSNTLFTAALKRMIPDERAMMESLDLIAPSEIQQQIQQTELPLDDTTHIGTESATRTLFWHKQDPLYLTDYNERRMAHYGRVAYANLRYSRPEHNIVGCQTDMGQSYIKYGRPLNKHNKRAEDRFKYGMDVRIEDMVSQILPETLPTERVFELIGTTK